MLLCSSICGCRKKDSHKCVKCRTKIQNGYQVIKVLSKVLKTHFAQVLGIRLSTQTPSQFGHLQINQ